MKILVVGDSCADQYVYGECVRLCPEAPVPIFTPKYENTFGGMAQNVFNNIVALKKSFTPLFCDIITNTTLSAKTRLVDARTNQMLVRIDECDDIKEKLDLDRVIFDKYDCIVVSDYDKGFLSTDQLSILGSHKLSFLDSKRPIDNWAKDFDFIKINKAEYEQSKEYIDNNLLDKTIITLGIDGCKYQGKYYPVVTKIETVDTSGAGDTFLAALSTEYTRIKNIKLAIMFAQQCCAKVISKRGTATP